MTAGISAAYTKGISEHISFEMLEYAPEWRHFYHVKDTSDRYIDVQTYEGYGPPQPRQPGGAFAQGQFRQSFNKRFLVANFGLGDQVAKEDEQDDMYGVFARLLPKKSGMMAQSFKDLYDIETAAFIRNNGFGQGTNGMADGRPLFDLNHPMSAAQSTVYWANRPVIPIDLSIAGIQQAITALRTQKRPNGITLMQNPPVRLCIDPSLTFVADQILKGNMQAFSSDRTRNDRLRSFDIEIIEWPYMQASGAVGGLTPGNYNSWFVQGAEHWLRFYMRQAYEVETDYDTSTRSRFFVCSTRFAQGAADARGLYGSPGI